MKSTLPLRGAHFGNLGVYVRGIVTYRLSPFQLKAFHGFWKSIPEACLTYLKESVHIVPFAIVGLCLHSYVEKKYVEMCRKNPKDYENDK